MIKTIDIKKEKYLLFVDTETIGSLFMKESVMPFEIGIKVYDTESKKVVKEKSYIVRKFFNNKYIMFSTFSATKYPNYIERINSDKRFKNASANDISRDIQKTIERYNIKVMVAHNGNFDKDACKRLFEEFGTENPFRKLDLLDTMEISKIITYSKDYANYCLKNINVKNSINESAFVTNSGRVRTTAQAIHSYLINEPNYEEEHTALEDIDIEINIFEESLSRLGNTIVRLNIAPTWRDYSKIITE